MATRCCQGVFLIIAAMLLVVCEAVYYQQLHAMQQGYYYQDAQNQQLAQGPRLMEHSYYQDANQQNWLDAKQQSVPCLLLLKSPSKTFTLCIQADRICTVKVSVPACSSSATGCKKIGENNALVQKFVAQHPEVYAEECMDSSGAMCLETDVKYHTTCSTTKATGRTTFCVMLSDGIERCSNLVDLIMTSVDLDEKSITEISPFKAQD